MICKKCKTCGHWRGVGCGTLSFCHHILDMKKMRPREEHGCSAWVDKRTYVYPKEEFGEQT